MPDPARDPQEPQRDKLSELEATRHQIASYQSLLQDVPGIFERKFRERLQPLLERNQQIAAEGAQLREQLSRALPQSPPPAAALPEAARPEVARPEADPSGRGGDGTAGTGIAWAAPPGRVPALLRWLSAGLLAGVCLAVLFVVQQSRSPQSATGSSAGGVSPAAGGSGKPLQAGALPGSGRPAAGPLTAAPLRDDELLIVSRGSWIELRDNRNRRLYMGILDGEQRVPIGDGLRLNAGRPDLITTRIGQRPARVLGAIESVGWREIRPLPSPPPPPRPRPWFLP